jgi:hypothetical protein
LLQLAKTMLQSLPKPLNKASGAKWLYLDGNPLKKGVIPCLSIVLLQEIEKFNTLLGKIEGTVKQL